MSEFKTDEPFLVKDSSSNALLSTDVKAKQKYLASRKQFQKTRDAETNINTMKQEIENLKDDLNDMKGLLRQIVDKIS